MIKRRFYREEHGDKDDPSSASSSSSSDDDNDSEVEAEATEESDDHAEVEAEATEESDDHAEVEAEATEESDDHAEVADVKENAEASSSSGYQSEDSSAEEIGVDSSDDGTGSDKEIHVGSQFSSKHDANMLKKEFNGEAQKESEPENVEDYVLQFKSVYRCRICPRIVCLTEEMMKTHLNSKRHVRSEKLLKENRLKAMLNSDGEIENQETPAEMHARVMALAQNQAKKKNKGRQRQKKRSRKKKGGDVSNAEKAKEPIRTQAKKRRKTND